MKLKNRLYPYPILSKFTDDYIGVQFNTIIKVQSTKKSITISIDVELDEPVISALLKNKQCSILLHIECSSTCYREAIQFNEYHKDIVLNADKVNDSLEINVFIIANNDISNFKSEYFNVFYNGISFDIDKYNILAVGDSIVINVDKEYDVLKNIRSIFSLIPLDGQQDFISYDYEEDIIKIFIPRQQFNYYKLISNAPAYTPIIHSLLIVPSLIEIFTMLSEQEEAWEMYQDNRWFRAIKNAFKKNNIEFSEDSIHDFSIAENAQKLIDTPLIKSFDTLYLMNSMGDDEL